MNRSFQNCILAGLLCAILLLGGCSAEAPAQPSAAEAVAEASPTPAPVPVEISEVMTHNAATLMAADGSFPDWIELYNPSDAPVSLLGLSLSDTGRPSDSALPDIPLPAHGRVLLYADGRSDGNGELHLPFQLSDGETLSLFSPEGLLLDALELGYLESDCSLCRREDEIFTSVYPSPGEENTPAGFDRVQEALICSSPLQISEVRVADYGVRYAENDPHSDWVELVNTSDASIELSDYSLSDELNLPGKFQLPSKTLAPGAYTVILCTKADRRFYPLSGFSLNAEREALYLSSRDGIVDFVSLHDIPYSGSYGRKAGENGFFYFSRPSMGKENTAPAGRRISEMPRALSDDGVFDDVDAVTVTLAGEGTIHYTTDGSRPNEGSPIYTEPLSLTKTSVVRAVAVQDNALCSPALTLSYILNEHHTLPVVSLSGDDPRALVSLIGYGSKQQEEPGHLALYENGERRFSLDCGFALSGKSSVHEFAKKNIKVKLRSAYGADRLGYDLFGIGYDAYDSLILRAGQDSSYRLFNTELWQDLCLEMSDSVLTQDSKFCIVYVNGAYYGIYSLKDNISPDLYAAWSGAAKETVEQAVPHSAPPESYLSMYDFICYQDMSDSENYRKACEMLDVASFIDWSILQGVSANGDLFANVKFFRTTEPAGKYQSVFFDLDAALNGRASCWQCLFGDAGFPNTNATKLFKSLLASPDFRAAFLRRYGEVYDTVLSDDNILARVTAYEQLLRPEIQRDRDRWSYGLWSWNAAVESLRQSISSGWQNNCLQTLRSYLNITQEEMDLYFSS